MLGSDLLDKVTNNVNSLSMICDEIHLVDSSIIINEYNVVMLF